MCSYLLTELLLRLYFVRMLDVARGYAARGWVVLPLGLPPPRPGKKQDAKVPLDARGQPRHEWQTLDVGGGLAAFEATAGAGVVSGIGVVLGHASGNLIDVDLDCVEAREPECLALLPPTEAIFGRPSAGVTHALYEVPDPQTTAHLRLPSGKVVEVRGEGGQTMFPGSWHREAMEPVMWWSDGPPGRSTWLDLRLAAERVREYVRLRRSGLDPSAAQAGASAFGGASPPSPPARCTGTGAPAAPPRPLPDRAGTRRLPMTPRSGTLANVAAIYQGCGLAAHGRARQEAGQGWSYDTWRLFAGLFLALGAVGEAEVHRLNALAGYPPTSLGSLFRTRPTTCSEFAGAMLTEVELPPDLRAQAQCCGTSQSPCAFRHRQGVTDSPSPIRHADVVDVTPTSPLLDPIQVRAAIGARLAAGVAPGMAVLLLGGCGLGKTAEVHSWIATSPKMRVVIVVPNHDLAVEQEVRLRAAGVIDLVRLEGLDRACVNTSIMPKIQAARRVGKPPQQFCRGCPLRSACGYWRAIDAARFARVVIATTARLATETFWDVVGQDRVLFVDEDPSSVLVPRHALTADDLDRLERAAARTANEWAGAGALGTADLVQLVQYLRGLLTGETRVLPAGDVPSNVLLPEAAQSVSADDLDPGSGQRLPMGLAHLMAWSSWVASNATRDPTVPVLLVDKLSGKPTVTLSWRATIPRDVPIVAADATGDQKIYEKLLRRPVQAIGGPTTPKPRIVRYHDTASSRSKLLAPGEDRTRALRVLDEIAAKHPGVPRGLVTFLKLVQDVRAGGWQQVAHYGLTRGTNNFRGQRPIEVGVVLGTHRLPAYVVRAYAVFVLGAPIEQALDVATSRRVSDRGHSVRVHGYRPGSMMARAYDCVVKAEVVQAIGRFADAHVVYVIADVPLDLDEEVKAACFDLKVPLPVEAESVGRPPKDLTLPKAVARELQSTGITPHAAAVFRQAHARGWDGSKRTIEMRWPEIEAALLNLATAPTTAGTP